MSDQMEARLRFVYDLVAPLEVAPGRTVQLSRDFDPGYMGDLTSKAEARARLEEGIAALAGYQDRLSADDTWALLLIFQALDAGGKDGTIKHVMSGVNPEGCEVFSFKEPSSEELRHDFIWRCAKVLPERGRIGIFNRSHYEEVLVVRVHPELLAAQHLPENGKKGGVWKRRYREINEWEQYLVDNGIHVVKVLLNLSKREQAKRFLQRIDKTDKNWKFSPSDIQERQYWDDYQGAFEGMLSHTSTTWAPWYVVPADHKWFARLATAAVLVRALTAIDPRYPKVTPGVRDAMAKARGQLVAEIPG
jgi:PPK2 family polyphosphate:nucleotide phosphotransferase